MSSQPEHIMHDLSWDELLNHLSKIVQSEEIRLKKNTAYFNSLLNNKNQDSDVIERIKQKILHEKHKIDLIVELLNRFENVNLLAYLEAIDFCCESEKNRRGDPLENYQIIIIKRENHFKTYYYPYK